MQRGELIVFGIVMMLAAGCGPQPQPPAGASGGPSTTPPSSDARGSATATGSAAAEFDPPRQFAPTGIEMTLRRPYRLDGTVAYQFDTGGAVDFDGSIDAVDLLTGEELWSVEPAHPARVMSQDVAPFLTGGPDSRLVIAAVPVVVQGSGTSLDQLQIDVMAVEPDTGELAWTTVLPGSDRVDETSDAFAEVVAADATTVVVNAGNTVYAIDQATHQIRWQRAGFDAVEIDGDVVVGLSGPPVGDRIPTGLDVAGGEPRWQVAALYDARGYDSGPGSTQITGTTTTGPITAVSVIVDVASGTTRAQLDGFYECAYDGTSVTVCADDGFLAGPGSTVAFDTPTLSQLWAVDGGASDRLPIDVSVSFHGAVYAATERGGVVLDARTGADLVGSLDFTPLAVSPYLAIADGTTFTTDVVHLATG